MNLNLKFKIENYQPGFTLIELIVSIAIVGILAATAVINLAVNEDRDVRQEKDRFTSFLREVQNKALTGDKEGIASLASEKICGYGVEMASSSSFKVFFVKSPDLNSDCAKHVSDNLSSVTKEDLNTFDTRNGVTVQEGSGLGAGDRIYFLVPHGQVYSTKNLPININLTKNSITPVPVTIDQAGRIY